MRGRGSGTAAPVTRRKVLTAAVAGLMAGLRPIPGWAQQPVGDAGAARFQVLVVGGGFAGASAAKALRIGSQHAIAVTLIEPAPRMVSAPLSNLVISGDLDAAALEHSYRALEQRHGVRVLPGRVLGIDPERREVRLADGTRLRYDRLVLATGLAPMADVISGLRAAQAQGRVFAAWSGDADAAALRARLRDMPDGGVCAIAIPEGPYACPPAPYERASLVADYLRRHKPRSKVLVLDANPEPLALAARFREFWAERYGARLEYTGDCKAVAVDADTLTVRFELADAVRADVLNVLPPVRAADLAVDAGLAAIGGRWCGVDAATLQSTVDPDIHVVGDAAFVGIGLPKSARLAHAQGILAAQAIIAGWRGLPAERSPTLDLRCHVFLAADTVIEAGASFALDPASGCFQSLAVPSAGSVGRVRLPAAAALAAIQGLWSETLD